MSPSSSIQVFFEHTDKQDKEFLYEADLIKDQRKDYKPSVFLGKHRFVAQSATMLIDWNSDEVQQWRLDIERLSRSPKTLAEWIADDLEMLVRCSSCSVLCRKPAILTKNDLKKHLSAGLNLEGLKTRLRCSKCGNRNASVEVF